MDGRGGRRVLRTIVHRDIGVTPNAIQSFTLTVNQAPAISSANSTSFTAGTAGTFTVTATGFPIATLAETVTLPSGVTFTDNKNNTGTLAWTLRWRVGLTDCRLWPAMAWGQPRRRVSRWQQTPHLQLAA